MIRSETALYGNIILKMGVIDDGDQQQQQQQQQQPKSS